MEAPNGLRTQIITFLRSIARDGVMPSQPEYEAARPRNLPGRNAVTCKTGLTWPELAQAAGLRHARGRRKPVLKRERQALNQRRSLLFSTYHDKLYTYIYRRVNDPHLVEDMTAQVFIKAMDAEQNGKGATSSESGWLFRIAHNLVIDYYRERDRRKAVDLEVISERGDDGIDFGAMANGQELQRAMQRLTGEQAQVIQMRFLQGYSFADIAQTMDKTEGAVKALQHRALTTMREFVAYQEAI